MDEITERLKPALRISEQIDLLKKRGLKFYDANRAYCILQNINYYKFRGYFVDFYESDNKFKDNIYFEKIYDCYLFDLALHKGLLPILETVETSLKTILAYYMAVNHGPLSYSDTSLFKYPDNSLSILANAKKYIEKHRNSKIVIKHEQDYGGVYPIWVWIEFLSFGDVSTLLSSLDNKILTKINMEFYLFPKRIGHAFLHSWYRSICKLRNMCSHYERLYSKKLLETPPKVTFDSKLNKDFKIEDNTSLFYYILTADMLCPDIQIIYMFIKDIDEICKKYNQISLLEKYNFPYDWQELLLKYNGYYIQYLI